MRKVVIDTDVYVDFLRSGLHENIVTRSGDLKYMSAVVLMELYAGAGGNRGQRELLEDIDAAFARIGRVVAPSEGAYREAGQVLSHLQSRHGLDPGKRAGMAHDVLIALGAREIGATVITRNKKDFEAIRRMAQFGLEIIA